MEMLGALGSMGASLIGGLFGQSNQQQQMQFAQQQASGAFVGQYANALRAAGINPAGGGFSPPTVSMPSGNPMGDAISQMGGSLQRALTAGSPTESKEDVLRQKLLQSQITHSDLINQQLAGSMVRAAKPEGLPFYGGTGGGIPIPSADPRGPGKGLPNMYREFYDNLTGKHYIAITPDLQMSLWSGNAMSGPGKQIEGEVLLGNYGPNLGRLPADLQGGGGVTSPPPGYPGFIPPGFIPN